MCGFSHPLCVGHALAQWWVDRPPEGCVIYCVLEVIINALEHSTDFYTARRPHSRRHLHVFLGCSFESWMSRAQARSYPEELLDQTFTRTSFLNGPLRCLQVS